MSYQFEERCPTPAEHRALANSVGWHDHIDDAVLATSLSNSLHGVVAIADGEVVGMARVVGDGAQYFYLQDVVVHPDHDGHGLGSELTDRLLTWVDSLGSPTAFVGLFASPEAVDLYADAGFVTTDMTGMHRSR
jgi:GNAT superfamily N-acetyltransferase